MGTNGVEKLFEPGGEKEYPLLNGENTSERFLLSFDTTAKLTTKKQTHKRHQLASIS